jgi:DNA polymerase I-like protein with 3'-5' exonuclease and polymerase domains
MGTMIIAERELTPLVLNPPPNITRVNNTATEDKLIAFLEKIKDFGFDVETTFTKTFFWRRVRTMQFGTAEEQYVIDLRDYCDGNADLLYNCQGHYGKNLHLAPKLQALIQKLSKYLCSNEWTKVGVNLGFEYECLYWLFGLRAYGWYDCMLAEKCIYAGLGGQASLKNYDFYSMESMFERYFGKTIDKTLQTSFNLEDDLSDAQFEYAALDTRTPQAIRAIQNLIANGETPKSLKEKGKPKLADYLYYLDSIILGDNLHEIIGIENEAIGGFIDMHVHGERIDRERWKKRVQISKDKLVVNIQDLDKIFLPIVGSKNDVITQEQIDELDKAWKQLRDTPTPEEIQLKLELSKKRRAAKKVTNTNIDQNLELQVEVAELEIKLSQLEAVRKEAKEKLKKECSEKSKRLTKINNLKAKCEGEALINYGSDAQLKHILTDVAFFDHFPKLFVNERKDGKVTGNKKPVLETLDDDTLAEYESIPVIKLIREYHGLSKEIGTYGDSWATEWVTHPCKEEGWLHPGDGRLHSTFNQLDAATGRSSSEQPNGQNLPQDKEVRSCFIADPPDENIRICPFCMEECFYLEASVADPEQSGKWKCSKCFHPFLLEETLPEEYVIVTADMSGAELRIMADDADDPVWVSAFARGEDVHSVGTELLYENEWPKEALEDCAYYKPHTAETVAKNPLRVLGEPQREKCKCPGHKERRDHNKATNFLLAYGGGPATLAVRIGKTMREAKLLMALHELKNPVIWAYLEKSGREAAMNFKAFDLYGRRRLLPEPTTDRARENCKEWNEEKLRLSPEECQKNIDVFTTLKGRKPKKSEEFELTHRPPNQKEVGQSYFQLANAITRQGKNHRIQGTNASIAKKAMGAGRDEQGIPFLFHTLPLYKARLIKFVHDELVVTCPKRYGQKVADLIGDAFKRAAAMRMHRVVMEFDYKISKVWEK